MDSRNVPGGGADGNIGGAERQYSGCERTVLKRNIAGFKEDDYSDKHISQVLLYVMSMQKSLNYQKAKYGKCNSAKNMKHIRSLA